MDTVVNLAISLFRKQAIFPLTFASLLVIFEPIQYIFNPFNIFSQDTNNVRPYRGIKPSTFYNRISCENQHGSPDMHADILPFIQLSCLPAPFRHPCKA